MPRAGVPDIVENKFSGMDVNPVQLLNVLPNIDSAGVPDIVENKFSDIDVNPVQPWNVPWNIDGTGAPDILENNPDGISPVSPVQSLNVE